jgi:hypothetical protein
MATVEPGETAGKVASGVENVGAAEQPTVRVAAGGSTVEALAGIVAVILSILGLVGVQPGHMFSIAVIAVGVALLSEGAALAARCCDHPMGMDMNAAFLGGMAGVVLGVLSLLEVQSLILAAAAVLVFGGALLLSVGSLSPLARKVGTEEPHTAYEATMGAAGAKVLVGVAVIVLGILALMGVHGPTMVLVALLILGSALMLCGLPVSSKVLGVLRY